MSSQTKYKSGSPNKKWNKLLCVVCNVNPRSSTTKIRSFKICAPCWREIREATYKTNSIGAYTRIKGKCLVCNKEFEKMGVRQVCSSQICRSKFYRFEKLKKLCEQNKIEEIAHLRSELPIIKQLGFDIKIVKLEQPIEVKLQSR